MTVFYCKFCAGDQTQKFAKRFQTYFPLRKPVLYARIVLPKFAQFAPINTPSDSPLNICFAHRIKH